MKRIQFLPQAGAEVAMETRSVADGIVVFAVAHNAREPNYWQSRK